MKLTLVNSQTDDEIQIDTEKPVILGRGVLLGCNDKKVSRKHGQIQLNSDGNVHLIALHSNPCFFMKNGLPPVHQLKKNEEKILANGDYIGLLHDSFWFRVVVSNDQNLPSDLRNSDNTSAVNCDTLLQTHDSDVSSMRSDTKAINCLQLSDIDKDSSESSSIFNTLKNGTVIVKDHSSEKNKSSNIIETDVKEQELPPETSSNLLIPTNETLDESSKKLEEGESKLVEEGAEKKTEPVTSPTTALAERLKALEHTKKLPLYMYEIEDFPDVPEDVDTEQEQPEQSLPQENLQKQEEEKPQSGDVPPQSSEIKVVQSLEIEDDSSKVVPSSSSSHIEGTRNKNKEEGSSTSEVKPDPPASHSAAGVEGRVDKKTIHVGGTNQPSQSSQKRPICQYEDSCYRKLGPHRVEFCHPGDPDYVPYKNRPMCQYGSSCYRKNKSHLVEFQHPSAMKRPGKKAVGSSSSVSPRRKKPKKETVEYETSEEEHDSASDPFAADGTSDEYVPTDSDSDGF